MSQHKHKPYYDKPIKEGMCYFGWKNSNHEENVCYALQTCLTSAEAIKHGIELESIRLVNRRNVNPYVLYFPNSEQIRYEMDILVTLKRKGKRKSWLIEAKQLSEYENGWGFPQKLAQKLIEFTLALPCEEKGEINPHESIVLYSNQLRIKGAMTFTNTIAISVAMHALYLDTFYKQFVEHWTKTIPFEEWQDIKQLLFGQYYIMPKTFTVEGLLTSLNI